MSQSVCTHPYYLLILPVNVPSPCIGIINIFPSRIYFDLIKIFSKVKFNNK